MTWRAYWVPTLKPSFSRFLRSFSTIVSSMFSLWTISKCSDWISSSFWTHSVLSISNILSSVEFYKNIILYYIILYTRCYIVNYKIGNSMQNLIPANKALHLKCGEKKILTFYKVSTIIHFYHGNFFIVGVI